ncbi:MAG: EamA family transporter [Melioribacteraceae bacterium]|nr:EamA family transporter [Melioribacteraceae bacterium]
MKSENVKIIFGYILICLLWGSTWLAIRVGLDSLTPIFSAGFRFIIAAALFYILIKVKKVEIKTDPLAIKLYLMMGFLSFVIPFGLVYWAEQFIPSGLASILFGFFPFATILFSRFLIKGDQIDIYQVAAVILGFIGLIVIFSENLSIELDNSFFGMLAVLGSAFLQGFNAVMIKKYGKNLNPVSMNFFPVLIAGICMMLLSLLFEDLSRNRYDFGAFFSVTYLAVFGTLITFSIYYWLMKRMNVVILSISSFITPIVAVILGWLILGEKLSLQDLFGSSLVLIGILFANLKGLKKYYLTAKK